MDSTWEARAPDSPRETRAQRSRWEPSRQRRPTRRNHNTWRHQVVRGHICCKTLRSYLRRQLVGLLAACIISLSRDRGRVSRGVAAQRDRPTGRTLYPAGSRARKRLALADGFSCVHRQDGVAGETCQRELDYSQEQISVMSPVNSRSPLCAGATKWEPFSSLAPFTAPSPSMTLTHTKSWSWTSVLVPATRTRSTV